MWERGWSTRSALQAHHTVCAPNMTWPIPPVEQRAAFFTLKWLQYMQLERIFTNKALGLHVYSTCKQSPVPQHTHIHTRTHTNTQWCGLDSPWLTCREKAIIFSSEEKSCPGKKTSGNETMHCKIPVYIPAPSSNFQWFLNYICDSNLDQRPILDQAR